MNGIMYDIITVGSATVDAFALTDKGYVSNGSYSFPLGAKILIKHLEYHTGGGGTNTAVAFSRLGLRAAFLGKVGSGDTSKRIINELKQEKVDVSLISREDARTGFSFIIDAKGCDRTIFAYKGSNDHLLASDVKWKRLKTKWFYFSSMIGKSFRTQVKLAQFAKEKGVKIAYNASMYCAKRGAKYLSPILRNTEIIILNKEEAQALSGRRRMHEVLRALTDLGPNIAVVTNGQNRVYAMHNAKAYSIMPMRTKVIETTGAGDAFAAAFVAAWLRKNDIDFALRAGAANSISVIKHYGAKNDLLNWSELIRRTRTKHMP